MIPAHNEEAVLRPLLSTLLAGADPGELEVIVVANGCTDRTADVAREFGPDVRVVETSVASKSSALNLGDDNASVLPRIYLDADIPIDAPTVRRLAEHLQAPGALAATPSMRVDTSGRPWPVRAYYRVWVRLPYVVDGQLAGVIGLSAEGRSRFARFPDITSDDLWVRGHFLPEERVRLDDCDYVVQAPWSLRSLVRVKVRSFAGAEQLRSRYPDVAERGRGRGGARGRARTLLKEPRLWPALACYVFVWSAARAGGWWTVRRGGNPRWSRDDTTRQAR